MFLKIVLVGDSRAGKSCLNPRFTHNKWSDSYISSTGVEF